MYVIETTHINLVYIVKKIIFGDSLQTDVMPKRAHWLAGQSGEVKG